MLPNGSLIRAVRPWRRAFLLEDFFPISVFGPQDRSALRRLAAICFWEAMVCVSFHAYSIPPRAGESVCFEGWRDTEKRFGARQGMGLARVEIYLQAA
jgi:hypothetical protein